MFQPTPGCCVYAHVEVKSVSDLKCASIFGQRDFGAFAVVYLNSDTKPFINRLKKEYPDSVMDLDEEKVLLFANDKFPLSFNNKMLFEGDMPTLIDVCDLLKDSKADHIVMNQSTQLFVSLKDFERQEFEYVLFGSYLMSKNDLITLLSGGYKQVPIRAAVINVFEFGSDTHEVGSMSDVQNLLNAEHVHGALTEAIISGDFHISLDRFVVPKNPPFGVNPHRPTDFFLSRLSDRTRKKILQNRVSAPPISSHVNNPASYHFNGNVRRSHRHSSFNIKCGDEILPWTLTLTYSQIHKILKEKKGDKK